MRPHTNASRASCSRKPLQIGHFPDWRQIYNPNIANVIKAQPSIKRVVQQAGDGYTVSGKLTMNGKSKDVSFPAKIDVAADHLNLTSNFKINRHDWNVSYGKGMVHDDVSLSVNVTAKK